MKKTSILKRFLCLALCMVLVLGFVPVQARALGAVASVSVNGTVVGTYETLEDTFAAVSSCKAEDNAVVTLLKDVTVEDICNVNGGVFTLDLNGREMRSAEDGYGVLQVYSADMTIVDSVGTGKISGKEEAITCRGGNLTITGGSFSADITVIFLGACESVTITGGSFDGINCISAYMSPVEITGGIFNAENYCVAITDSDISITGGIFSTNCCNLNMNNGTAVLNVGDDGTGATFLGGLNVTGEDSGSLGSMLGEGAAYWQGDVMVIPTENQWKITCGDVVIKTPCTHENGTQSEVTDNADGKTHSITWDCCGTILVENHGKETILETAVPDCEQDGYTRYYCDVCGAEYMDDIILAPGHAFGEDGICTQCGYDINGVVIITMMDKNADGWNGAAIGVYENGDEVFTVTCESDNETFTFTMEPDANYKFRWEKGSYDEECAFTITVSGEVVCYADVGDCTAYEDGQTIYPICEHDFVYSSGAEATCEEGGYAVYVCSLCGDSRREEISALGHAFGEDGICANCGVDETKNVTITMTDKYADSWNGAAIDIYENESLLRRITCASGEETFSFYMKPDAKYKFRWIKGNYDDECTFTITIGGEVVCYADVGDCTAYEDGQMFYPICEHDFVYSGGLKPTCDLGGYSAFVCSLCGEPKKEEIPALGHAFGKDGICTACGGDYENYMVIHMSDTYGDGWSGNGIAVLEDGEEIAIATLEDGYDATWGYMMDPDKEYSLRWIVGRYAYECYFRITIGDTTVYEVSNPDCQYFNDGYGIYPPCDHELTLVEVVEATCVEDGYSVYRCSLCDALVRDDYVPFTGHTLSSEGVVILPTCTEEGYTTYACEICGEPFTKDYVDPLGHTPSGNAEVVQVECLVTGVTIDTCVDCGDMLFFDYIPMPGHTLGEDGNCTVCGEPYKLLLSVAGVEVTYENYQDILGDGTAFYDPATNTLTLKDFVYEDDYYPAVNSWMPLNIVLEGTNSIVNGNTAILLQAGCGSYHFGGSGSLMIDSEYYGILAEAEGDVDLTFGGDISITFTSRNSQSICVDGSTANVTVEDSAKLFLGTAECPLVTDGILVGCNTSSTITITDNALVEAVAGEGNIKALSTDYYKGNLIISGNAALTSNGGGGVECENVTISGGKVSITVENNMICLYTVNLTVTGGDVELISGAESESLAAANTVISGGSVVAMSDFAGVYSDKLTVSGGSLTASGGTYGISTNAGCNITGGRVTVLDGGLCSMMVEGVEGDPVTLGGNMQILQPQGAVIGELEYEYGSDYCVLDENGAFVSSFVIGCDHDWADGACVHCGEKLYIKAEGFTLSFENEILVNFYYSTSVDGPGVEHGVLVFQEEPQEVSYDAAADSYISQFAPQCGFYMIQSEGIPAKEMGDKRYYVAYAKLADGTYVYSDVCGYSPADYAYNKLADENAAWDLQALCVAMLNYGAEAQKYFGYRTDSLMNAALTPQQQALAAQFEWDMLYGAVESNRDTSFIKTEGFDAMGMSVSFEGALAVNYYFVPSVDVDNMQLYYWTQDFYDYVDSFTPETALGDVEVKKLANGTFWAQLTDIPAKGIDDTIYVAATYEVDGVTYCTGIVAYSISTYCLNQADGPMGDLAFATAAYGCFARQYFSIIV